MKVNKKTVKIASGVVGLILGASACGGETYTYDVSGPVEGQQIDYDCPGTDLSMGAVAFIAGSGKGSSGGSSGKKSDSKSPEDKKADDKKVEKRPQAQAPAVRPSTKSPSPTATKPATKAPSKAPSKAPANKGVSLKSKPEKPERLKSKTLPKVKYRLKPKGCETEYEVFVWGKDGYLYEQDVRKVDYDKCLATKVKAGQKAKLFPLCTKG